MNDKEIKKLKEDLESGIIIFWTGLGDYQLCTRVLLEFIDGVDGTQEPAVLLSGRGLFIALYNCEAEDFVRFSPTFAQEVFSALLQIEGCLDTPDGTAVSNIEEIIYHLKGSALENGAVLLEEGKDTIK